MYKKVCKLPTVIWFGNLGKREIGHYRNSNNFKKKRDQFLRERERQRILIMRKEKREIYLTISQNLDLAREIIIFEGLFPFIKEIFCPAPCWMRRVIQR